MSSTRGRADEALPDASQSDRLVKTRQRVIDHGEVFTPSWLVEDMLDLVEDEAERIDSRFLEPACGSGNFLVPVLRRKLATVKERYGSNSFERDHHALLALMCIYGMELLPDNVAECRENLLNCFKAELSLPEDGLMVQAAAVVLHINIVSGDALAMTDATGAPITFAEWSYLGKGRFKRRDFRYENLAQAAAFGEETLFGELAVHEIFAPVRDYELVSIQELANG